MPIALLIHMAFKKFMNVMHFIRAIVSTQMNLYYSYV